MDYGICNLSIVPCRAEPSDKSEMTSQLLFGEAFKIIDEKPKWVQVENHHDHYVSWINKKQFLPVSEQEFQNYTTQKKSVVADLVGIITQEGTSNSIPIALGSLINAEKGVQEFSLASEKFVSDCQLMETAQTPDKEEMLKMISLFMNAPYLWGGRSPFGIDCSGFVQIAFRFAGLELPRDAYQQAEKGETLNFIEETTPGDLAFFDNEEGNIIHVGIILDNNRIMHAHGKVRIDKLDHEGIFNSEINGYSHHLRVVKRII